MHGGFEALTSRLDQSMTETPQDPIGGPPVLLGLGHLIACLLVEVPPDARLLPLFRIQLLCPIIEAEVVCVLVQAGQVQRGDPGKSGMTSVNGS